MEDPLLIQSAVRLPTPPPPDSVPQSSAGKWKRSPPPPPGSLPQSSSVKRKRSPSPPSLPLSRPLVRAKVSSKPPTEEEKQAAAKAEYDKLVNARSGGTYIPPARLRALQAQITDKASKEYQRLAWEALKKAINGLINKANVANMKYIVPELFQENLIRGRGLFVKSIMKAQAASLPFTPIYATLVAIVNTKLSQVGELLLTRLVIQFKKAYKRNDKSVCLSSTTFIAHLVNRQVVHEALIAKILVLLLERPTDDSVEVAVGLTREVGQHLEEFSGPVALLVFDRFRNILHEHDLDKRVAYMIEVLFQIRKEKFKQHPAIREELDLVEEEDQITHQTDLEDDLDAQDSLNIFKFDSQWEEHETAYGKIKAEILGEVSGSESEDDESEDVSDDEEAEKEREMEIKDQTNTDLVNLRRTIYLTIMSSPDFEQCVHKLMKVNLPPGQEPELPSMIIECCSQERTYSKFFGLVGERFAKLNRYWMEQFEMQFSKYYSTVHRLESNKLRNVARFFGHLLSSDAIGWHCMSIIHLNEDETTSSSRIFIKILVQDLSESLGLPKLPARFLDEALRPSFEGIFPRENPRNIRFSINFFTSIGMGAITEEMRERLKNMPKPANPTIPAAQAIGASDSALFLDHRLRLAHDHVLKVEEELEIEAFRAPRLARHPDASLNAAATLHLCLDLRPRRDDAAGLRLIPRVPCPALHLLEDGPHQPEMAVPGAPAVLGLRCHRHDAEALAKREEALYDLLPHAVRTEVRPSADRAIPLLHRVRRLPVQSRLKSAIILALTYLHHTIARRE